MTRRANLRRIRLHAFEYERPVDPDGAARALSCAIQAMDQDDLADAERWLRLSQGLFRATAQLLSHDAGAFDWVKEMRADERWEARRAAAPTGALASPGYRRGKRWIQSLQEPR